MLLLTRKSTLLLHCAPSLFTFSVQLFCAPPVWTTSLKCAPTLSTFTEHIHCVFLLCTSNLHLHCAPIMCTSTVHLTCKSPMYTSTVQLYCVFSRCHSCVFLSVNCHYAPRMWIFLVFHYSKKTMKVLYLNIHFQYLKTVLSLLQTLCYLNEQRILQIKWCIAGFSPQEKAKTLE